MKIVFLLTQDLNSPSGLGRYAPMARELARLDHQVTIYALHPDYGNLGQKSFSDHTLRIRYVARMHVRKQGNLKTYYSPLQLLFVVVQAIIALTIAVLRERPDVIWVGKPHPMNGIAGLIGKIVWKCPLYLDCDDDEAGSGTFRFNWQRKMISWFENWLPRHAERITVNTLHTYENIVSQGIARDRIIYLPNGIDSERFSGQVSSNEVESLKHDLNLVGSHIISYIGTLSVSSHAVDLLVAAFGQLIQQQNDVRLLLVGGGEDFELLRAQVSDAGLSDRVTFTGRIHPDKIEAYYRISDVTVDPVYNNIAAKGRSPLKVFEAWACGVPLVTSAVGDRGTLAGTPPAALFVAEGNPSALAEGLNHLLIDPRQRDKLRSLGYARLSEFTWRRLVERVNCFLS